MNLNPTIGMQVHTHKKSRLWCDWFQFW